MDGVDEAVGVIVSFAVSVVVAAVGYALLIWPDELARRRVRGFAPQRGATVFSVGKPGAMGTVLGVVVLGAVALAIGAAVSLAGVMVAWTAVRVVRGNRRRSARRAQAVEIMRATETLSAELRAGAEPARALKSAHRNLVEIGAGQMSSAGLGSDGGARGSSGVPGGGGARGKTQVTMEFERAAQRAAFGEPWVAYLYECANARQEPGPGSANVPGGVRGGAVSAQHSAGIHERRSAPADSSHVLAHPDLERLARAWQTAQRSGLPMADIVDNCHGDIAARMAFRSRTGAALAGPRMTILILASLPGLGLALGQAFGAAPLTFLTSPGVGAIVLITGTLLSCAGVLWGAHILGVAEGEV